MLFAIPQARHLLSMLPYAVCKPSHNCRLFAERLELGGHFPVLPRRSSLGLGDPIAT